MIIPTEAQVFGLAFALFIFDSLLLLYVNEGILTTKGRAGWRMMFGSEAAGIRGQNLFCPNLFVLHKPLFRLSWQFDKSSVTPEEDSQAWQNRRFIYSTLTPMIYALAVTLFGIMPLALFFYPSDTLLLLCLGFAYLNLIGCIAWLYWKRDVIGLSNKKLFSLSFECLVCPPIALNLVRRLSIQTQTNQDLISVACHLLAPADWAAAKLKFLKQLDQQIVGEEEDSERYQLLYARRMEIAVMERSV